MPQWTVGLCAGLAFGIHVMNTYIYASCVILVGHGLIDGLFACVQGLLLASISLTMVCTHPLSLSLIMCLCICASILPMYLSPSARMQTSNIRIIIEVYTQTKIMAYIIYIYIYIYMAMCVLILTHTLTQKYSTITNWWRCTANGTCQYEALEYTFYIDKTYTHTHIFTHTLFYTHTHPHTHSVVTIWWALHYTRYLSTWSTCTCRLALPTSSSCVSALALDIRTRTHKNTYVYVCIHILYISILGPVYFVIYTS
jgi:hypothetical protein